MEEDARGDVQLLKYWAVCITKIARGWIALCLLLPLKAQWDRMGHEAPELGHIAIPKVSPHAAAIDQVPPTPRPLKMTRNPTADPSPPMWKRMLPAMMSMQRFVGVMLKS